MHLCNYVIRRSLKTPPNKCKIELKVRLKKYCVLIVLSEEKDKSNANSNNIAFAIIFVFKIIRSVVTLSAKDNKTFPKLLNKGFERSVYWS